MSTEKVASSITVAPYGAWKSPISAEILTQKNVAFGEIAVANCTGAKADVVFVENRPQEAGRAALIRKTIDLHTLQVEDVEGEEIDLTRGLHNARSGVHEYGGGAMMSPRRNTVMYTDYKSFNVFEVENEGEPQKLTADNALHRFADFTPHPHEPLFVCVLEDHTQDTPQQVVNTLVSVSKRSSLTHTLVSGSDFYANPRISPDGKYITWVSWNHPSMPFFATQLWIAQLSVNAEDDRLEINNARIIGKEGADEVSHHPVWVDDTTLVFSNDRTNFGNLYKVNVTEHNGQNLTAPLPICQKPMKSEFISPFWILNASCFVPVGNGWLACTTVTKAITSFILLHIETGEVRPLKSPFVVIDQLRAIEETGVVVFNGVQSNEPSAVVIMDLKSAIDQSEESPRWSIVKRSSNVVEQGVVPREYLTKAEVIEFPTELPSGEKTTAHAVIFPPCNLKYRAPAGTSPPCIVKIHGGPTANANSGLNLSINYWTSRGYMICMVNYGGSTGYGREYMLRLEGQWGVVDVRDAVAAAKYLGSPRKTTSQDDSKAERRISRLAQTQMANLTERRLPSGAIEFTLHNPGTWSIKMWDILLTATLCAVGALVPGLEVYQGAAVAGLAWLYSKLTHVQKEIVLAIPTVGLQLTTVRGFSIPTLSSGKVGKHDSQRQFTTSKQTKLIPRDCILDVVTNEAFRRWGVVDYLAVATRPSPASASSASRGHQLEILFPNLLPRLPVVERVYRSVYPALFYHESPSKVLHDSRSTDVEKGQDDGQQSPLPLADPDKIAISGGSAGGFTVLASLCLYPNAFKAGCSSYGVSDIAALDAESHKFESRYTERLMGGSPSQVPDIYRDRSPINMANKITSPVLLLQGDIDKIVPPEQSESMYKEILESGTKAKYILFEGEGHGFRKAENIKRALEEEEAWYRACFHIGRSQA
ncbi:hypothetical protein CBS101457_003541 [Exobasidium rhododendri]|nr:hypothetical protein CBS101457_003541 [Exobasidium rhododendri]